MHIFDRTSADNLSFFRMRCSDDRLYNGLAPLVAKSINKFDLTLFVQPSTDAWLKETKFVSSRQRASAQESLKKFFANYGITTKAVRIESGRFRESIATIAEDIAADILQIVELRDLSLISTPPS